jgi:hypothetical protein
VRAYTKRATTGDRTAAVAGIEQKQPLEVARVTVAGRARRYLEQFIERFSTKWAKNARSRPKRPTQGHSEKNIPALPRKQALPELGAEKQEGNSTPCNEDGSHRTLNQ